MFDDPRMRPLGERLDAIIEDAVPSDRIVAAKRFVEAYYESSALDDLNERDPASLYGAALAHLNLARSGDARPLVSVYNPQFDKHGWQSTHSVVQVVVDDMPFLIDSIQMVVNGLGLTTHLVVHPVVRFRTDTEGRLEEPSDGDGDDERFAVMHFEVDRIADENLLQRLEDGVRGALEDVRGAVADWRAMVTKVAEAVEEIRTAGTPVPVEETQEAIEFLSWLGDNNFTFLGYREYQLREEGGSPGLVVGPDRGLGVLRGAELGARSSSFDSLTPEMRARALEPGLLVITKANSRSTVHRPGYMDYVGVKRWSEDGRLVGERRFVGLYTAEAYNRSPRYVPFLRRKVLGALEDSGFPPSSHAGKALTNILDTFPRDILFQIERAELRRMATAILHLQERQRTRLLVHPDHYGRFVICLVYVPRDRFNTENRRRIQDVLAESFGGEIAEFTVHLSESVLARLYFVIRTPGGIRTDYDVDAIQRRVVEVTRAWADHFQEAMVEHCGEAQATRLLRRYREAFRADYRENYSPRSAVYDVEHMEALTSERSLAMSLYRPLEAGPGILRFKLFRPNQPIPLSDALPMLENMGLKVEDETPSKVKRTTGGRVWMHDFGLRHDPAVHFELDEVRPLFQDCFAKLWSGEVENDGFNRLVLRAGLGWREIVVLRAYSKYLKQVRVAFSQSYIEQALCENAAIARDIVELFVARFAPAASQGRSEREAELAGRIHAQLDAVENLDQDRILRAYLALVRATLRTNYFQYAADGTPRTHLSFKFDPAGVPDLPPPRPMFEIFVYSPRVEGVHLRGGPVARGGLRWSDRPEDFRTEVLGLVKAQMVKNAVIVPMGSKGGFVAKQLPPGGDRSAIGAEVVECYRIFVGALLEITDNLDGEEVVAPAGVVRHDGDDPYLVVAADKGTATFSDVANEIAQAQGFWLGDAFASGGSAGYDHKGMGITARGAWESVKRHFRELGIDTQGTDFTVVGIGDMGGDVFGNGMLLSEHIKLVAAFNHLHVFIDPDPDPARSFAERKRLFELPGSTWADYAGDLISAGGGVFPRSAKSIRLAPRAREVLGVAAEELTPTEVVAAILRAPVDLLWNGGIGTYVKASPESHADVGDRANDAVRANGRELRCRVVGEGGNLGVTQLGRTEFARGGGRIHSDAIDNSAGVDCSDHEVNIKILVNGVVQSGDMTLKQRNALLAEMTDEVGELVLRNNYLQTQALSVALAQAPEMLDVHVRMIEFLEREGGLSRAIEYLPDREQLMELGAGDKGLSSPELAVLLAYEKIRLYQALLRSKLPDDPYLVDVLVEYFPAPLRDRFRSRMDSHRLRREIISTLVANEIVNRGGITFVFRMHEETGAAPAEVARAYLIAKRVFAIPDAWEAVEELDNRVSAAVQASVLLELRKLAERGARWVLRNRAATPSVQSCIDDLRPGIGKVAAALGELLPEDGASALAQRADGLQRSGVPAELAARVAAGDELLCALDIVDVANRSGIGPVDVGGIYFELGRRLDLDWLLEKIVALPRDNRWQTLARAAMRDDLYGEQRLLIEDVLHVAQPDDDAPAAVGRWMESSANALARCRQVVADLMTGPTVDFSMLSVAMRELRGLGHAPPALSKASRMDAAAD